MIINKYYLNGIDPKERIGKNGPIKKEKGESVND